VFLFEDAWPIEYFAGFSYEFLVMMDLLDTTPYPVAKFSFLRVADGKELGTWRGDVDVNRFQGSATSLLEELFRLLKTIDGVELNHIQNSFEPPSGPVLSRYVGMLEQVLVFRLSNRPSRTETSERSILEDALNLAELAPANALSLLLALSTFEEVAQTNANLGREFLPRFTSLTSTSEPSVSELRGYQAFLSSVESSTAQKSLDV
jgi:hypothetical protein